MSDQSVDGTLVRIPAGTKTIDLVVDECGSIQRDHSIWAYPEFQVVDFQSWALP
jgi:hypothetical protein